MRSIILGLTLCLLLPSGCHKDSTGHFEPDDFVEVIQAKADNRFKLLAFKHGLREESARNAIDEFHQDLGFDGTTARSTGGEFERKFAKFVLIHEVNPTALAAFLLEANDRDITITNNRFGAND